MTSFGIDHLFAEVQAILRTGRAGNDYKNLEIAVREVLNAIMAVAMRLSEFEPFRPEVTWSMPQSRPPLPVWRYTPNAISPPLFVWHGPSPHASLGR